MTLSAGDRLGRYEIVGPLGAGGMGEVYRARDTELERDVAIKVLPEAVAENPDRLDRFRREAKAVAKLAHPNILEIWDFGTEGDTTHSVTELLEGETLRERLEGGTLGWRKATEIGAAIADGLAAAHEAGIVHRDLKPSNVFVTNDGRVKVLDFGLARHDSLESEESGTQAPTLTRHTDPGTVLGTVGYMSPEQVSGRAVDHRSDIFSLGCVLYEMVSGQRAFVRDTAVETMNAILKEEPADISASGEALPPELAGTVRRCLEKKPQSRFQSASDLAYNLRTISSTSATTTSGPAPPVRGRRSAAWIAVAAVAAIAIVAGIVVWAPWRKAPPSTPQFAANRVAILPLENRTGDQSLDTLGVMATDLIVQRFTETGAAEVVPMNEAALEGALESAREQGAGLLLSGASYLDGDTLRLQARLTDVATGDLIYAFEPVLVSRDAAAEGIGVLRERAVAAVAAHLFWKIDISVIRPPATYQAFQAYVRGEEFYEIDWRESVAHYERALDLDPDFYMARIDAAFAHTGTRDVEAFAHHLEVLEGQLDHLTPFERALVQYLRSMLEGDRQGAVSANRRAVELAPHLSSYRTDLGIQLIFLNRPREALQVLDPLLLSSFPRTFVATSYPIQLIAEAHHMLGEYERELEYANLGLERFPDQAVFYSHKACALAAMGRTEAVDKIIDEVLRVQTSGRSAGGLMSQVARELWAHGHRQEGDLIAARSVEWYEAHPSTRHEESRDYGYSLWMLGRWRQLEDVAAEMIDSDSATVHGGVYWHGVLGVIAAIEGNLERAMQISEELPAGDHPYASAYRYYWRAAITAHLGDRQRAVELLAEAFSLGLQSGVNLHRVPEFEPLWDYPPFQELIKPKG